MFPGDSHRFPRMFLLYSQDMAIVFPGLSHFVPLVVPIVFPKVPGCSQDIDIAFPGLPIVFSWLPIVFPGCSNCVPRGSHFVPLMFKLCSPEVLIVFHGCFNSVPMRFTLCSQDCLLCSQTAHCVPRTAYSVLRTACCLPWLFSLYSMVETKFGEEMRQC